MAMSARTFMWTGLVLIILALVFNTLETAYFGWNMWPKSAQESVCDNFSIVALVIGFVFFLKGIIHMPVKDKKITIEVRHDDAESGD